MRGGRRRVSRIGYQDETMVSHHTRVSYHKIHDQVARACESMDLTIIDDSGLKFRVCFSSWKQLVSWGFGVLKLAEELGTSWKGLETELAGQKLNRKKKKKNPLVTVVCGICVVPSTYSLHRKTWNLLPVPVVNITKLIYIIPLSLAESKGSWARASCQTYRFRPTEPPREHRLFRQPEWTSTHQHTTHSLKMDGIPTENTFFCCIHVVYSYPYIDVPYTHKCLIQSRHLAALGGRRVWAMRVVRAQVARNGLITWVETVHANQLHSSSLLGNRLYRSVKLLLMGLCHRVWVIRFNQPIVQECRAAAYGLCHRGWVIRFKPTNNQEHATKQVLCM